MKKQMISIFLAITMVMAMLCATAMTAYAATEIRYITVDDILEPLDGYVPDISATSAEPAKYAVTKVEWTEYDDDMEWQRDLLPSDTYKIGNYYFVFVTLEAADGYVFSDNALPTVNNEKANKYAPTNNGKNIQIYYCFDICKKNIARVDLTIVNPVIGKTPTFARVNTEEYESKNTGDVSNQTNGVTWTNQSSGVNLTVSNAFKEDTKYTVKYYLTAKENYWFNGTKYYINGKQVSLISSNAGMTAVVVGLTDLVPGDGKKVVDAIELTVTAPKEGEKPTYNKIDGTGYFSDNGLNGTSTKIYKNGIAWYKSASSYISPGTSETFEGGTEYTVKIALTPKDGYKFGASVTAKINGKAATVETFDDGSIHVSVKLTATKKDHTHTADSTWQCDDTAHWKICSDKSCGTLVGEKQTHTNSDSDGKCDTCGYQLPVTGSEGTGTPSGTTAEPAQKPTAGATEPTEGTTGTSETTDNTIDTTDETAEPDDSETTGSEETGEQNKNSSVIWIVLGAVLIVAAGSVVAVCVMKKKN